MPQQCSPWLAITGDDETATTQRRRHSQPSLEVRPSSSLDAECDGEHVNVDRTARDLAVDEFAADQAGALLYISVMWVSVVSRSGVYTPGAPSSSARFEI